jgi:large subunit ribosomal protein L22
MAKHNYAYQKGKENIVKAVGRNLDISPKQSIEICNYIRGRPLAQAKMLLRQSIDEIRPIPARRFMNGLGHKPGMSAGRYFTKACIAILKVLESAEANAKNKGFNNLDLRVSHIAMQIGPKNQHYGRQKRSIFKNSHIEVVLEEIKGLSDRKKSQAGIKTDVKSDPKIKSDSKNIKPVKKAE